MQIEYRINPPLTDAELNALFASAWPEEHVERGYRPVLERSLGYVCAYRSGELVGFANLAGDGGAHAFLLDPTVRPDQRRQGIGTEMVRRATELTRQAGAEWLHVDYEARLADFYRKCGFRHTEAGLMRLGERSATSVTPENRGAGGPGTRRIDISSSQR
jgi:GNAT superfamily N-acetyltransferase